MPIRVVCTCGKAFQVKDEFAGKKGKCAACGKIIAIPRPKKSSGGASRPSSAPPAVDQDLAFDRNQSAPSIASKAAAPRRQATGNNKLLLWGGAGAAVLLILLAVGYFVFLGDGDKGPSKIAQGAPRPETPPLKQSELPTETEEAKQKAAKDDEARRLADEAKAKAAEEAKAKLEAAQKKVAAYRKLEQETIALLELTGIQNIAFLDGVPVSEVEEAKRLANEVYSKHGGGAEGLRKAATAVAGKWPKASLICTSYKGRRIDELAEKLGAPDAQKPFRDQADAAYYHYGWLIFLTRDERVNIVEVDCGKAEDPVSERKPFVAQTKPAPAIELSIKDVAHASLKLPANPQQVFVTEAPVADRYVGKPIRWKGKLKEVSRKDELVVVVTVDAGDQRGFACTYEAQLIVKNKEEKLPAVGSDVAFEGTVGQGSLLQNFVNLKTGAVTFRYLISVELTRFVESKQLIDGTGAK